MAYCYGDSALNYLNPQSKPCPALNLILFRAEIAEFRRGAELVALDFLRNSAGYGDSALNSELNYGDELRLQCTKLRDIN
jgi:hypothetical protein